MKYKFETDDELEAKLLTQAKDYHFLVWDFVQKLRADIKYSETDSELILKERERIREDFLSLLDVYNIDINLLP